MHAFPLPVVGLDIADRQTDEVPAGVLLPGEMRTYRAPQLPETAAREVPPAGRTAIARHLHAVCAALAAGTPATFDLADLDDAGLTLLDQMLGEGEVSARIESPSGPWRIQESVFAGVWRLRGPTAERLEVGPLPAMLQQPLDALRAPESGLDDAAPGLSSAPALLREIHDRRLRPEAHAINLTLLPFTPEDGAYLDRALGRGRSSILSRGYGNCRISATGLARVWWVQYFNAQDALILNSLEITDIPEIVLAAAEDLADSQTRLAEVLLLFAP